MEAQIRCVLEGRKLVERAARWLLMNRRPPFDIAATVGFFAEGVATVRSAMPKLLAGRDLAGFEERRASFLGLGVPAGLADEVAAMVPTYSAFDIVQSAAMAGRGSRRPRRCTSPWPTGCSSAGCATSSSRCPARTAGRPWPASALRDDLYGAHAALTRDVLAVGGAGGPRPEDRLAAWEARNEAAVGRAAATLGEIWESERFTFTTLSVALRAVRTLVATSSLPVPGTRPYVSRACRTSADAAAADDLDLRRRAPACGGSTAANG